MIEHVWRRCCQAVDAAKVIIATDDERIEAVARGFGARVEMTSSDCLTGTDRVAEVADRYPADWYVNVQGDEPFLNPEDISRVLHSAAQSRNDVAAVNAMSPIEDETSFHSPNVPKVVTDFSGRLLYISRSPIPVDKNNSFHTGFRQVGLYAFSPQALRLYGPSALKARLESIEDIEVLRLLENGRSVQMITVAGSGPAVDTPGDLEEVRDRLRLGRS